MNNLAPLAGDDLPTNHVADSFLNCLGKSRHETQPFDFWLLQDVLPEEDVDALVNLPISPAEGAVMSGKRETNNALRVYFTPENQELYPVCKRVVDGFQDQRVRQAIEQKTGTDLTDTKLRIEYCQDSTGFWLEPHTDIFVKKFTMLVYLSDDPALKLAGTDIHEGPPDFKYVTSAPYGLNLGVIFIPSKNSWHGVGHNKCEGLRRSIIINYVSNDWRDTWELA